MGTKLHQTTVTQSTAVSPVRLTCRGLRYQRSSSRGAATSPPLPFRARALESAAVASRYRERRQKWRYFPPPPSTSSPSASRKRPTLWIEQREGHSTASSTTQIHNVRSTGASFARRTASRVRASPSAFVSWQQGEPQLTDS